MRGMAEWLEWPAWLRGWGGWGGWGGRRGGVAGVAGWRGGRVAGWPGGGVAGWPDGRDGEPVPGARARCDADKTPILPRAAATMGHGCVSGGVRRVWDGLARAPGALRGGFTTAGCPRCQRPGAASCPGCRECRECRWREAGRAAGRGHAARRSRPRHSGIPGIRCSPPPGPGRRGHFTSAKTKAKCPRLPSKILKDPPHSQGNAPMGHGCLSSGVTVIGRHAARAGGPTR